MEKTKESIYGTLTFADFAVAPLLKANLTRLGLATPTRVQVGVIPPALEGKDILGTAQTGTGKTLAFALPTLNRMMQTSGRGIECLVLVPTRELAEQVMNTYADIGRGSGVSAVLVVGGASESGQLNAIRHGARLVIATPGRLNDYIRRGLVDLKGVKMLILDEADRMVDMGFLPQMQIIMNVLPSSRQTMCFSATLDREVAHLVHAYLKNPARIEIGSVSAPAESVALRIYEVSREQRVSLLAHLLETEPGTFLVFTRTKHGADKLQRKLVKKGYDAVVLHGGRSQAQRTRALGGFKEGKHRVLVATDIAARGIHVQGIAHVINFDLPQAPDDFIHRVGRTGRVEASGIATTFVMSDQIGEIRAIERTLGRKIERLPVPAGLETEARSMHDEIFDMRARPGFRSQVRHFGNRRRRR